MYKMTPNSSSARTVISNDPNYDAGRALSHSEIEDRLQEVTELLPGMSSQVVPLYLIPGHPLMWLSRGFIELVSFLPCLSSRLSPFS